MATSFDSPSSIDITNSDENQNDFIIRTMQDDLNNISSLPDAPFSKAQETMTTPLEKTLSKEAPPFFEQPQETPRPVQKESPTVPTSLPVNEPTPFIATEPEIKEVSLPSDTSFEKHLPNFKIIITTIIILIICIASLGGYYFWMTSAPKEVPVVELPQPIQNETTPQQEEAPVTIAPTPTEEKYSVNKPNYLTLDLAVLTSDDIKKTILDVANELKTAISKQPYEFIVVDSNNNPVAFPIFATASKINFSPTLLGTLNESFSLFIYNDGGNPQIGLSLSIMKADTFAAELLKQEKTLPTDLSLLFLDSKPEITTGGFKDGSYGAYKTRYMNLNAQETLSIDYAINNSVFMIGTSKNTLRALLDKSISKQTQPQKQESASDPTNTETLEAIPANIPETSSQPATSILN